MWEMIARMADDRLWIYTAIVGSLFGAAFLAWFQTTRMGLWAYDKFNNFLDYLVRKFNWKWLEKPYSDWRDKYPHITKKIDNLEFRIQQLEKVNNKNEKNRRRY